MAEHTPRPWVSMYIGGRLGQQEFEIGPEGGPPVAVAYSDADAELIVAAPDLLEACEAAMNLLVLFGRKLHFGKANSPTMALLAAAIARAKGE
jgi:hypothetical protein